MQIGGSQGMNPHYSATKKQGLMKYKVIFRDTEMRSNFSQFTFQRLNWRGILPPQFGKEY